MGLGVLIITRQKSINGLLLDMNVYIDDKLVGSIKNNEQKEFNLSEGKHIIKVTQRGKSGEQEIDIKGNEVLKYNFHPTPLSLVSFINLIIAILLSVVLNLTLTITALLMLPGFIISIYSLTKGREKYFKFALQ